MRFDAATALRLLADNAESHAALLAEPVIQAILQAAGVARAPRHAPTQAKALGALRAMAQCGTDATRAALARAGACDAAESALESEDPGVRRAGAGARAELAGPRALGEDSRSSPPPLPSRTKWTRLVHPSVLIGRDVSRWTRRVHFGVPGVCRGVCGRAALTAYAGAAGGGVGRLAGVEGLAERGSGVEHPQRRVSRAFECGDGGRGSGARSRVPAGRGAGGKWQRIA